MTCMEFRRRTDCSLDQSGEASACSLPKGDSGRSCFHKEVWFHKSRKPAQTAQTTSVSSQQTIHHSLRDLHFCFDVRKIFHLARAFPSLSSMAIPLNGAHLQNSWLLGFRRIRGTKSVQTYPCVVSLCSPHSGLSKFQLSVRYLLRSTPYPGRVTSSKTHKSNWILGEV